MWSSPSSLCEIACNEALLIVLFSQARILSFPVVWILRRVCRTWCSAIESSAVLSSHVALRKRISSLQGVAVSREGLRDIILADHIVEEVQKAESRGFCTAGLFQSVRVQRMLGMLGRLSMAAATAACSLLGSVSFVQSPVDLHFSTIEATPVQFALAALAIASAAAELGAERVPAKEHEGFRIVIAQVDKCDHSIECLTGSYLVVPPGITRAQARRALARAFTVFARVHEVERDRGMTGAELVTAVTGVRLLPASIVGYLNHPKENHLWVGMLLFREDVAMLAGELVFGNSGQHGVDPTKKCVLVPWNYFDHRLASLENQN
eukprot:m51a1_g10662 hypothetical protein (322) ;mRNA; r:1481-2446